MSKDNYHLYTFDYINFDIIEWLTARYGLTCFDTENALYLDKTITGTKLANRISSHLEAVIQREVEGALPDDLLLGSIEQKVNNDPDFKGFLLRFR